MYDYDGEEEIEMRLFAARFVVAVARRARARRRGRSGGRRAQGAAEDSSTSARSWRQHMEREIENDKLFERKMQKEAEAKAHLTATRSAS